MWNVFKYSYFKSILSKIYLFCQHFVHCFCRPNFFQFFCWQNWHTPTNMLTNQVKFCYRVSWRKCVFKQWYSLLTFLTNSTLNPKDKWLHCQEQFPAAVLRKQNFRREKCFDSTGACSNDAKVTLPCQTDLARVQLVSHQISLNFKIVCHLAELDGIPKFAKKVDAINVLQLLQGLVPIMPA